MNQDAAAKSQPLGWLSRPFRALRFIVGQNPGLRGVPLTLGCALAALSGLLVHL